VSVPASDLHETIRTRLSAAGRRYTGARRRLIDILIRSGHPVAIPEILRRKGLAQSSVYRNLGDLERAGVVRRIATDEEHGRYELAEDLTGHHHHRVCSSCGRVRDLEVPADLEHTIERALDRLAAAAGFAEVDHRLDVIGLCEDCAGPRRRPGAPRPRYRA
jgi:Fe2+ or Zn2+ uptake regulation protein